jgi:hypothetical protein
MNSKENNIDKTHKKDLGLGVPENYFSTSKNEILSKIAHEKKARVVPFYKNKLMWFSAAGITLLVALTVFKPNVFPSIDKTPLIVSDSINKFQNLELVYDIFTTDSQNIAIASLFMNDAEISNYIENNIIEEILIDEKIDSFMLESMFSEEEEINFN